MTPVSFPSLWTVQRLSEPPDSPPDSQPSRAWIQAGPDPRRRRRSGSERARARRASPRRRRESGRGAGERPAWALTSQQHHPPPVRGERERSLSLSRLRPAERRSPGGLLPTARSRPKRRELRVRDGGPGGPPSQAKAFPSLQTAAGTPRLGVPVWTEPSGLQRLWTPETLEAPGRHRQWRFATHPPINRSVRSR